MRRMSFIGWAGLCASVCLAGSITSVYAQELRVLLTFDNAGHQVQQIVRPASTTSIIRKPQASVGEAVVPDISKLSSELARGYATLAWLDDQGYLSAVTREPDPRVSHAPTHITGMDGSRVGERKGAWFVSGPENAKSLIILMPGDPSVGLASEQWEVQLETMPDQ